MTEKQKVAQPEMREPFKVAETTLQNTLRAWRDLTVMTTDWSMDLAERSLRYGQEVRGQVDRALYESFSAYRKLSQDGLKAWQNYVQGVNETLSRAL